MPQIALFERWDSGVSDMSTVHVGFAAGAGFHICDLSCQTTHPTVQNAQSQSTKCTGVSYTAIIFPRGPRDPLDRFGSRRFCGDMAITEIISSASQIQYRSLSTLSADQHHQSALSKHLLVKLPQSRQRRRTTRPSLDAPSLQLLYGGSRFRVRDSRGIMRSHRLREHRPSLVRDRSAVETGHDRFTR